MIFVKLCVTPWTCPESYTAFHKDYTQSCTEIPANMPTMNLDDIQYLYALIPIIFAGISNMIFVKSKWLSSWYIPIDNKKILADGRRLFGDNKTWKGFIGMIILTAAWTGVLRIYPDKNMLPKQNWWFYYFGAMLGLAYVLFELPNSFIKRRLNIPPEKM